MARHLILAFYNNNNNNNSLRSLPAAQWPHRKALALPVTVIRNNVILFIVVPSQSAEAVYGKKQFSGRCRTSTFSSPEGVNISFYIKDLLRGCIDVSRQLSLISNALFLTFTTMCHYKKNGLDFSGMTFRH